MSADMSRHPFAYSGPHSPKSSRRTRTRKVGSRTLWRSNHSLPILFFTALTRSVGRHLPGQLPNVGSLASRCEYRSNMRAWQSAWRAMTAISISGATCPSSSQRSDCSSRRMVSAAVSFPKAEAYRMQACTHPSSAPFEQPREYGRGVKELSIECTRRS